VRRAFEVISEVDWNIVLLLRPAWRDARDRQACKDRVRVLSKLDLQRGNGGEAPVEGGDVGLGHVGAPNSGLGIAHTSCRPVIVRDQGENSAAIPNHHAAAEECRGKKPLIRDPGGAPLASRQQSYAQQPAVAIGSRPAPHIKLRLSDRGDEGADSHTGPATTVTALAFSSSTKSVPSAARQGDLIVGILVRRITRCDPRPQIFFSAIAFAATVMFWLQSRTSPNPRTDHPR